MKPFKTSINYYPHINSGHTIKMAAKIDPWRMYCNMNVYQLANIGTYPDFKGLLSYYTEYILFQVNGNIDYSIITSLN